MKNISIIGAGGHTRSSINIVKQNFRNHNIYIFDDSFDQAKDEYIDDIKLTGKIDTINDNDLIFISIGDNQKRTLFFNKFNNQIIKENLLHQTVIKEHNIKIGISNQIFANVYINSFVEIGDNNIINTSSILEHEVKVGNHNHIAIGAKLCGRVTIENYCMIGAGAVIIDKISICNDVIIGAGAIVTKNITQSGTYIGTPARKIK